jgi:hypothetical protein
VFAAPAGPAGTAPEASRRPGRSSQSDWLTQRIENSRRAARQQACPTCGLDVLVGPSDDPPHWTARVDPTPVTPRAEVVALLKRGPDSFSYDLHTGSRLFVRDRIHHAGRESKYPILLDHECETAVLFS